MVKFFSDKIAVMYLGQLVETADSAELFRQPLHPYSQALLSAIPIPSSRAENAAGEAHRRASKPH